MTVNDIFMSCGTQFPSITIYDRDKNVVFSKEPNTDFPYGKCDYINCKVAWIYEISVNQIILRIC